MAGNKDGCCCVVRMQTILRVSMLITNRKAAGRVLYKQTPDDGKSGLRAKFVIEPHCRAAKAAINRFSACCRAEEQFKSSTAQLIFERWHSTPTSY